MMLTMNNVTHEAGNKKYGEAQHNTQYLHTIYTLHIHMYTICTQCIQNIQVQVNYLPTHHTISTHYLHNIYTLSALRVGAGKWDKRPGRKRSVDKD